MPPPPLSALDDFIAARGVKTALLEGVRWLERPATKRSGGGVNGGRGFGGGPIDANDTTQPWKQSS